MMGWREFWKNMHDYLMDPVTFRARIAEAQIAADMMMLPLSDADRLTCGVPGCRDGRIVLQEVVTVVECDTHDARTTHDTVPKPLVEQKIIRVQDAWRQHGTKAPPK